MMKIRRYHTILTIIIAATSFMLHSLLHSNLFSFFVFPVVIASLLPYMNIRSLTPLVTTAILFELFSTSPTGTMISIIILSFVMRRVFRRVAINLSASFLGLISMTVGMQLIIISFSYILFSSMESHTWMVLLYAIPYHALLTSWISTTVLVFGFLIMWSEIILPHGSVEELQAALHP